MTAAEQLLEIADAIRAAVPEEADRVLATATCVRVRPRGYPIWFVVRPRGGEEAPGMFHAAWGLRDGDRGVAVDTAWAAVVRCVHVLLLSDGPPGWPVPGGPGVGGQT